MDAIGAGLIVSTGGRKGEGGSGTGDGAQALGGLFILCDGPGLIVSAGGMKGEGGSGIGDGVRALGGTLVLCDGETAGAGQRASMGKRTGDEGLTVGHCGLSETVEDPVCSADNGG